MQATPYFHSITLFTLFGYYIIDFRSIEKRIGINPIKSRIFNYWYTTQRGSHSKSTKYKDEM